MLTFLRKNGQSFFELEEDIFKHKSHKDNIQYANQFEIEISREMPSSLDLDSKYITGISVSFEGIELEQIKLGSGYLHLISGVTPSSLSITFEESRDEEVKNFLILEDGVPIIPRDGTFLLAEDYYFNIKLLPVQLNGIALSSFENPIVVDGSFMIEGELQRDYQTGENTFSTMTANFKPLNSQAVEYS